MIALFKSSRRLTNANNCSTSLTDQSTASERLTEVSHCGRSLTEPASDSGRLTNVKLISQSLTASAHHRVSEQMQAILDFVGDGDTSKAKCSVNICDHLFGRPDWSKRIRRGPNKTPPLTATQRASVCRSVKRLVDLGFVSLPRRAGCLSLTAAGLEWQAKRTARTEDSAK
jgi:hypothetical protein